MKKGFLFVILLSVLTAYPFLEGSKIRPFQEKTEQATLQHEVAVVMKLVQVFVTDKKGNPVTDLTKEDFILYDNGKLQTITDFEKHILEKPDAKTEEALSETELPPPQDTSSRLNRKFFLLLDIERNDGLGMIKSKKAALHFIETQTFPSDEIAFLTYSSRSGLVVREYLTTDHDKVTSAINKTRELPGGIDTGVTGGEARELLKRQILLYLEEIRKFAKSLRYIPGFKNIILFSSGINRNLVYDNSDPSIRFELEGLSKELSSSSSPVYTVNTEGIKALAKNHGLRGDHSLMMLSDLSGGKYYVDVARYEQFSEEIQDITSNYYVLGYYVNEEWDGKFHEIKVKVTRKGCEVHAQGGYYNPEPFPKFTRFEKNLHLLDLALSEKPHYQDPLHFSLSALPCSQKKNANIALIAAIPQDVIEEVGEEECEIVAIVFSEENEIVESHDQEIDLSKTPLKNIYPYAILSVPPGQYKCRIIMRNLRTGRGAVGASATAIPEPIESGIRLFPPLLLAPGEKLPYLNLSGKMFEDSSLVRLYPFLGEKYVPLFGEAEQGISKVYLGLRYSTDGIQEPEAKITARLIDRESRKKYPLTHSILSTNAQEDTVILILELHLPELKPGEYSLEMIAQETKSQSRSEAIAHFKVR